MKRPNEIILLAFLLIIFSCSNSDKGFSSAEDFLSYFEKRGYCCIGLYDNGWPAKIIPEKIFNNKVAVSVQPNEVIQYEGFEGFDLKLIVLKTDSNKKSVAAFLSGKYSFLKDSVFDINSISYYQLLKLDIKKVEIIVNDKKDAKITMPARCFNYLIRHVYGAEQNKRKITKGPPCVTFHEYIINDKYRLKASCEFNCYECPKNDLLYLKGNQHLISYYMNFDPDFDCIKNLPRE